MVLPFVRQGLENGERCLYVADATTLTGFQQALQAYGVDTAHEHACGALLLWTRAHWRPQQLRERVADALASGFRGLCIVVEMTVMFDARLSIDKLRDWEATINEIVRDGAPCKIICQYNRRRLSPDCIGAGVCRHPLLAFDSDVFANPFYEAPFIPNGAEHSGNQWTEQRLQRLFGQLRWVRAFEAERRQRQHTQADAHEAGRLRQLNAELQDVLRELQDRQADLDDFFENGPIGLCWLDSDGLIVRANRAELRMLGYAEHEYVGHPAYEFQLDQDACGDFIARLRNGETIRDFKADLRCRDGSTRKVFMDASALIREGVFVHARCFTRDITDQERLLRDALRLSAIVETSDDAIVSKDLNGTILSWNPGAERLFGYTAQEAIGRSIRMIIPAEHQAEEDEILAKLRRGERIDHYETIRQRKDGSRVAISLTVSPLQDRTGKIIGASKIARDITERKRADEALRFSITMKDQFLGLVSHELRTPISTVFGNGQLLLRYGDKISEPDRLQAVTDIVNEAERLQRIVEHLLLLTRLEGGELQRERLDLGALIEQEAAQARRRTGGRLISVSVEGAVPPAAGNNVLTRLVLENLLSNADKYSRRSEAIELVLKANAEGEPEVHVLDRGLGVRPDERETIFETFYRSPEAQFAASGMGLGLPVCKRILEAHGGRIWVQSRPDGGSDFTFTLPAFEQVAPPKRPPA